MTRLPAETAWPPVREPLLLLLDPSRAASSLNYRDLACGFLLGLWATRSLLPYCVKLHCRVMAVGAGIHKNGLCTDVREGSYLVFSGLVSGYHGSRANLWLKAHFSVRQASDGRRDRRATVHPAVAQRAAPARLPGRGGLSVGDAAPEHRSLGRGLCLVAECAKQGSLKALLASGTVNLP